MKNAHAGLWMLLGLVLAAAPGARAQAVIPGDSIRFRTADSRWQYGRVLAVAPNGFEVQQGSPSPVTVDFLGLARLERWQRTNKGVTLVEAVTGGMAGGLLSFLLTPAPQRTGFYQDASGPIAVGAGVGLVMAPIIWALQPGRWKVVRAR